MGATDRFREELDKLGWHADELAAVSRKVDWDAQRANAIGKEVWRRLPCFLQLSVIKGNVFCN